MALDREEAKQLAVSIEGVARHYDVAATEKTMAWTSLLMTVGMVYGSRIIAVNARKRKARAEKARNVTPEDNTFDASAYAGFAGQGGYAQ